MDDFSGHMTEHVKENLRKNLIFFLRASAKMKNLSQPLDLTVNRSFKASMKKIYTQWYSKQIAGELDRGIPSDDIETFSYNFQF